MKKSPRRKPRGSLKYVKVVSGNSEESGIIDAQLPNSKDEIELEILRRFIEDTKKRPDIQIKFTGPPNQNKENDLDFSILTTDGLRWIELMEVAPLEMSGGRYESVAPIRNSYDDAEWVYQKLKEKSDNYGSSANKTLLLLYVTEEKLGLNSIATTILKHWSVKLGQGFEKIFLYTPLLEVGIIEVIFPSELDESFNPENYKEHRSLHIDTSSMKIEQNKHGSAVSAFISPMQLFEAGIYQPSRNSICPCGSGIRFKHCHGKLK